MIKSILDVKNVGERLVKKASIKPLLWPSCQTQNFSKVVKGAGDHFYSYFFFFFYFYYYFLFLLYKQPIRGCRKDVTKDKEIRKRLHIGGFGFVLTD